MTAKRRPKPPPHLAEATRTWWKSVVEGYALEPHHLRLLQLAGEAWDRAQQARTVIENTGLTYQNRFGDPVLRPEVAVERDSRLAFARLVRELDLDVEEPVSAQRGRPPALRSNRG
jgi:phage terminase small subunit